MNLEIVALDTTTPQLLAPQTGDGYLAPRTLNITPEANTSALTASSYSVTGTGTTPMVDLSGAWSTTGTATLLKANLTADTGPSNAASLLMDLQVAGASKFNVTKAGVVVSPGIQNNSVSSSANFALYNDALDIRSSSRIRWSNSTTISTMDLVLARDDAGVLAQRNAANAQTFRIYNTYTDASNYERGKLSWSSNVLQIGTEKAGTGTARALELQTDGTSRWSLGATTGHLLASADNTYDIGAVGGSRPRTGYFVTSVFVVGSAAPNWWLNTKVIAAGYASLSNYAQSVTTALDLASNLNGTGSGDQYQATGFSAKYSHNAGAHIWYTAPSGTGGTTVSYTQRMQITNSGLITFGGTTSSFPALKRSSATLISRLADDSANAAFEAASLKTDAPAGGTAATWKLGAVSVTSPTSPDRTIEVDIGGTIYYLHAKTTND